MLQFPKFQTQHQRARANPLLQGCYDALRDLKAMCEYANEGDYYVSGYVKADEVWDALEPLRKLVFEVDGTATAARLDSMTDKERIDAVIAHDKRWRSELFGGIE